MVVSLAAIIALSSLLVVTPPTSAAYAPHAPIYIEHDENFTAANGVTGGGGTSADPYIIDGWEINASSADWAGIYIGFTRLHFVIRNVFVHSGLWRAGDRIEGKSHGVVLEYAPYGRIEGSVFSENRIGIYLRPSAFTSITRNEISRNDRGVVLLASSSDTIAANTFVGDGVTIWGNILSDFNSHTITPDNSVNGKPLLYYKDGAGLDINGTQPGQLIVANYTGVRVANLAINATDIAVELAFVRGVRVLGNRAWGNADGMYVFAATDVLFANNSLTANRYDGVGFERGTNVTIAGNAFLDNGRHKGHGIGVEVWFGWTFTFVDNDISANHWDGVSFGFGSDVTFASNRVRSNGQDGIVALSILRMIVVTNEIARNVRDGMYASVSDFSFAGNIVLENSIGLMVSGTAMEVSANRVEGNGIGIHMGGLDAAVVDNEILWNWDKGLSFLSITNLTVRRNGIEGNGQGISGTDMVNVLVAGNEITWNSYCGINVLTARDAVIEGDNASMNSGCGIDVWGDSANVTVRGNLASGNGGTGIGVVGSDAVVMDNVAMWNGGQGIGAGGANAVVVNNTASWNGWTGVAAGGTDATVSRNVASWNAGDGLFISGSRVLATENIVDHNDVGITVWDASDSTVAHNEVTNHSVGVRVQGDSGNDLIAFNEVVGGAEGILVGAGNVTVSQNNVSAFAFEGIRVTASNVTVEGNRVLGCGSGLWIDYSRDVAVRGNTFSSASWAAVYVDASTNVTISGNGIGVSAYGLIVEWTGAGVPSVVLVHHNRFVANAVQAVDGLANRWDDGYPSGGNYWSTYAGPDRCRGPRQDVCDAPDGIGDVPFVIDADSVDRYPLTSPAASLDLPPRAVALGPRSGWMGEPLTLDASGSSDDHAVVAYRWSFGDGATDSGITVTHAYASRGTFTVTLTVSDARYQEDTDAFPVSIGNRPPVADAGPERSAFRNAPVALDGSGSYDLDGDPLTFRWVQLGGAPVLLQDANQSTATFRATLPGVYAFRLTVEDGMGASSSALANVTVVNRVPAADAGPDRGVRKGETVTLDGRGSEDLDGDLLAYTWRQTDGPAVSLTGGGTATPTFVARAAGVYRFELTVEDGHGGTASDAVGVTVWGVPPVANLSASVSEVVAGVGVVFEGGGSADPDGVILAYAFDFGDGVVANGTEAVRSHAYARPGIYTVILTVTDDDGNASSASVTVRVVGEPASPPTPWWNVGIVLVSLATVIVILFCLVRRQRGKRVQRGQPSQVRPPT